MPVSLVAARWLTRDRFSAFHSFYLVDVIKSFGKLDHRRVLGVHLEEIDQVRSSRTIEYAFFNHENRVAKRVAVQHRAAHAAAGAGAGDQQAIDIFAHEIGDQVRAEKG